VIASMPGLALHVALYASACAGCPARQRRRLVLTVAAELAASGWLRAVLREVVERERALAAGAPLRRGPALDLCERN